MQKEDKLYIILLAVFNHFDFHYRFKGCDFHRGINSIAIAAAM